MADSKAIGGASAALSLPGPLPAALADLPQVAIVCGHYGVGKSNLSLNLALSCAQAGRRVTVADIDVVNPYFRSSDYAAALAERGVRTLAPEFAGTALDVPSISGRFEAEILQAQREADRLLILDVGGDDVGATVLGRFAPLIAKGPYRSLYVVNACRDGSTEADEALLLLREIESQGRLRATDIVNNTHLQGFTDVDTVLRGIPYAQRCSERAGLPLACTCVPAAVGESDEKVIFSTLARDSAYLVQTYVQAPWG